MQDEAIVHPPGGTANPCPVCGAVPPLRRTGRPATWCSGSCRQAAYRARRTAARALRSAADLRDRVIGDGHGEVRAAESALAEAVLAVEQYAAASGHWEDELAAKARALARAAAQMAELADRHARVAADYRAARATFRHPDAGLVACDETGEHDVAETPAPASPPSPDLPREEGPRPQPHAGSGRAEAQSLRDIAAMRRVRDRIDREYARPLNVQALARGAHMSVGHLSREFRRVYGESPYSYLMTRRIERAMTLLRRGDLSVTDICFAVGYGSLGTFSTRFTELVGVPPSAYRRDHSQAGAGIPPCLAKQVTRPVKNQEARDR